MYMEHWDLNWVGGWVSQICVILPEALHGGVMSGILPHSRTDWSKAERSREHAQGGDQDQSLEG